MVISYICSNCGAEDLIKSDLCGDYCIYCLDLEELYREERKEYEGIYEENS